MDRVFCEGWDGSNCQLGGQAIMSLAYTESLGADYDGGNAMCLAPNGKWGAGTILEAVEGGVSTGYWCVEDAVDIRSGEQTWARKVGDADFGHIPLVQYALKRKGWQQARSTISRDVCPGTYPPRFCSTAYLAAMNAVQYKKLLAALLAQSTATDATARAEAQKAVFAVMTETTQLNTRHAVSGPAEIADTIAGWVGLPHFGFSMFTVMPDTYEPMGKTVMTALKEIAGWSGLSVCLDRNGTLQVYDYVALMGSGAVPTPATVLSEEYHDALYPTTEITVVGTAYAATGQGHWDTSTTPHTWVPWDPTQDTVGGMGARAVEETRRWDGNGACVEQRIEIKDYPITEELASKLATEQMASVVLESGMVKRSGPAEGKQSVCPLHDRVFAVTRSLRWADGGYEYDMTIEAPGGDMPSSTSSRSADGSDGSDGDGSTERFGGGDPVLQNEIIHERRMQS